MNSTPCTDLLLHPAEKWMLALMFLNTHPLMGTRMLLIYGFEGVFHDFDKPKSRGKAAEDIYQQLSI
jgi:hypothetical protein